ncbi:MAG: MFS transporter, partial [Candidatus Dormibacteraceae bacterium]
MALAAAVTGLGEMTPQARKATLGAFFGLAVDFYDIYLPVVALTPAIIYFEPKGLAPQLVATLGFVVFAVTLIGRPIGAFIFGHFGDVIGRKRTTMIAVSGFAVFTLLIALLPGYQTWGVAALIVLIVLRLIDGIFMGGEYTSANPLAMEACPKALRGIVGGFIQAAYPIAYVAISISVVIMLAIVPGGSLSSPYVQWGWRIPFVVGAILGGIFVLYYSRVQESHVWAKSSTAERVTAPLKQLFRGSNLRNLGQVFLLQSGQWLAVQAAISVMPGLLQNYLKLPAQGVTVSLLVANIALACGYIVLAILGQMHGRRRWLIISGCWMGTVCVVTYGLMVATGLAHGPFWLV